MRTVDGKTGMVLFSLAIFNGCENRGVESVNVDRASVQNHSRGERGQVSRNEFRRLDWIVGSWQGTTPVGKTFFETYRYLNDTTIQMYTHAYSPSGLPTDSARIYLSQGRIYSESRSGRWTASAGERSLVLLPLQPGNKRIRWSAVEPTVWHIDTEDAGIRLRYTMNRISTQAGVQ